MAWLIVKIARLLRVTGVPVSATDVADCLAVLESHGSTPPDKYLFYDLVNATMVKAAWGKEFVMWLVELYFGPDLETAMNHQRFAGVMSSPGDDRSGGGRGVSMRKEIIQAAMTGNLGTVHLLFRQMGLVLDPLIEDREQALESFQDRCGWLDAANLIAQAGNDASVDSNILGPAQQTLEKWLSLIETEVDFQLEKNMSLPFLVDAMKARNPEVASFVSCRDEHMALVSREVKKLGKRLAVHNGFRLKPGRKGKVNLARTVRLAMKKNQVPMDLVKMVSKPSKPRLWLICDVSNSVRKFIYFMMLLAYTTQNTYSRIRSFLFVDNLMEATDYFKGSAWQDSLLSLKYMKGINVTGFSDYGKVLRQFKTGFLDQLTPKTTVIVLGDARNNGHRDDGCDVLPLIRERAAALYWLSPFDRQAWTDRDCLMHKYQPHCTGMYPCPDVRALSRFLSDI